MNIRKIQNAFKKYIKMKYGKG